MLCDAIESVRTFPDQIPSVLESVKTLLIVELPVVIEVA